MPSVNHTNPFALMLLMAAAAKSAAAAGLPAPDGPHAVGTTVWHMIDERREDTRTEPAWDRRELMVRAWSPTAAVSSQRAAYGPVGRPRPDVATHSLPGPAPTPGPLPVVLIAPGRGLPSHVYWSLAETLASHGYMAVAVDSPHSGSVSFPDGRFVAPSPDFKPPPGLFAGPHAAVDAFFEPAARDGAADLVFVLDRLGELHRHDPAGRFRGRLALDRVGAFGHSLGGRIAGAAAAMDDRIVALLAVEGIAPRAARRGGLDAAVAVVLSAGVYPHAIDNVRELIPNRRSDVFIVTVEGFGHNSVTDLPLLGDDDRYPTDARDALLLSGRLTTSFFDHYLRAAELPFDEPSRWPAGVRIEAHPSPGDGDVRERAARER